MHLHWLVLFFLLTAVYVQSDLPATPLFIRRLRSLAQSSETYTQTGPAISTKRAHLHSTLSINNTDGSGDTYQLSSVTTQGMPQELNKTSCYWRRRMVNGGIIFGRQSNGTCTPTFENDTAAVTIRYTRNLTTCRLIDDENTQLVLSSTTFEVDTLLPFDRNLPSAIRQGVVFYGSSSPLQCFQQFKRIVSLNFSATDSNY